MTAIAPRGWCPSVFEPMPTGDGLLARVKPPGGALAATAARWLAKAAARFGNGAIELTGRGNIQVRGLAPAGAAAFAEAIVAAGLADPDPVVERRRAVIAAPLAGVDPGASPHARPVAAALESLLARDARIVLPTKFCVAVDAGGVLPLLAVRADFHIAFAGDRCVMAPAEGATPIAVGWLRFGASELGAFGFGAPFGVVTPPVLDALAGLTEAWGDGALRVTPWRAFVIAGVRESAVPDLLAAGAALGLIVAPDDPRRRVVACPGMPACASATVDARGDAAALARLALPETVHVSGCGKGCAHPAPAKIALVGEMGRYSLVRNGRAGDAPCARGLSLAEVIAALSARAAEGCFSR